MKKTTLSMMLLGSLLAVGSQAAFAAPDWSKVPKRDIHVFHPGVSPMEWVGKKSDHSGTAGLKKGETCVGCHEEKGALNFDFKRLAGKDMEPKGAPKTMNYPVAVQAAYDASNLYIRLTFKAPAGGADYGNMAVPSVWRTNRTQAAARVDALVSGGMDDLEIPAFLRKQAD